MYAQQLIARLGRERDLCSRERDGIGIELRGNGREQDWKLVPCNTLVRTKYFVNGVIWVKLGNFQQVLWIPISTVTLQKSVHV